MGTIFLWTLEMKYVTVYDRMRTVLRTVQDLTFHEKAAMKKQSCAVLGQF